MATKEFRKPTLKELWAWWKECERHSIDCEKESCEWWFAFSEFRGKNNFLGD